MLSNRVVGLFFIYAGEKPTFQKGAWH